MPAVDQDFTIYAGNDVALTVTLDGDADSLTGAEIRWWVAPTKWSPAIIRLSSDDEQIEVDTSFAITLTAADTDGKPGIYYHEAEIIDSQGRVSTILTGSMTIRPTIVRAEEDS